jgi:Family of unknown function (DUF5681)
LRRQDDGRCRLCYVESEKWQEPMTETKRDYEIGYRKPPVGRRFKKGQSGNPSGRPAKSAKSGPPLLVRKFDEQVVEATNGRCQKTTRCEVVMVQLVDQSAVAGLSAAKILNDLLKEIEKKASLSPRPAETV